MPVRGKTAWTNLFGLNRWNSVHFELFSEGHLTSTFMQGLISRVMYMMYVYNDKTQSCTMYMRDFTVIDDLLNKEDYI